MTQFLDRIAATAQATDFRLCDDASNITPCEDQQRRANPTYLSETELHEMARTSERFKVVIRIKRARYELRLIHKDIISREFGLATGNIPARQRHFRSLADCLALAIRISRNGHIFFERD
ncbi:MAG: hypothetical protein ACTHLA_13510 [Asticcacaulis sp.]|uniref:hypothetical protein n=1 Tax=Asticcacaulis sp. TaxID=1872648 RepID=UPI003F7BB49F